MKNYIKVAFTCGMMGAAFSGCDSYLDTMPDNRATLDSEEKVRAILTSSYIDHVYSLVAELSSDNVDSYGMQNPNGTRFLDDAHAWKDEIESNNESLERFWSSSYIAISSANEALKAIDELGGPEASNTLKACRGEALVSRAYNHFMLANMFCWRYDKDAASHLGLPYMVKPETSLNPQYERGNLKDFYDKIQTDIEEGLPLISDDLYNVPKYHFNVKAAWALATRFYLYTEQWEKAADAATNVVGSSPKAMLRDYKGMSEMTQNITAITNEYINPASNANLLLHTNYSILGMIFGNYSTYSRYSHGAYVSENEDICATNIWGGKTMFWQGVKSYRATNGVRDVFWKMPNLFEYTDINAGTGYRHSVVVAFSTDEALLNRAEAYIMLGRYDEAAADLTTFMQNITKSTMVLTPENIAEFYNEQSYCYEDENKMLSGLKKHLNPAFAIDTEGSIQECMLQCVLGFRRIETIHAGLRWFDIKRYGIEIPRRVIDLTEKPSERTDWLSKDDPRRAMQVPLKVRDAGFEPNPR